MDAHEQTVSILQAIHKELLSVSQCNQDCATLLKDQIKEVRMILIGIDGNPEGIQAIRDGRIDATISQNPITMGDKTIQMVYDYVKNGTVPESETESPQILINKANIDSAEVKAFGLWADELKTR